MSKSNKINTAVRAKWKSSEEKTWWYQKFHAVRRLKVVKLSEQQGHRCCYCSCLTWIIGPDQSALPTYAIDRLPGMTDKNMATLEHIITVSQDGSDRLDNLIMACCGCNEARGDFVSAMEFWAIRTDPDPKRYVQYLRSRSLLDRAAQCLRVRKKAAPAPENENPVPKRDVFAAMERKRLRIQQTIIGLACLFSLQPDGPAQLQQFIMTIESSRHNK